MRAARHRAGLTQQQLADRAGVSFELVSRIERGRGLPSVPTLIELARVLRASTDYLLGIDTVDLPRIPPSLVAHAQSLAEELAMYAGTPASPRKRGRGR